jgi:hypothetical protein
MVPGLVPGTIVLARSHRRIRPGDVVVATMQGREVIKRVKHIQQGRYYLVGDNSLESTDSRELGPINSEKISGVMIMKFPVASPPQPWRGVSEYVALAVAAVIVVMVTTQLVRFDTFVPILAHIFVTPTSLFVGAGMVTVEVFALPFLLAMSLSPLARWTSMACAWGVAIGWTTLGALSLPAHQVGYVGTFAALRPGLWGVVFGVILCLAMLYLTLTALKKRR